MRHEESRPALKPAMAALCCGIGIVATTTAAQAPPASVVVAEVRQMTMDTSLTLPATVKSRQVLEAAAARSGRLVWIAEPGDRVTKGGPLATLDAVSLELERAEQETLAARQRLNLRRLKSDWIACDHCVSVTMPPRRRWSARAWKKIWPWPKSA